MIRTKKTFRKPNPLEDIFQNKMPLVFFTRELIGLQ